MCVFAGATRGVPAKTMSVQTDERVPHGPSARRRISIGVATLISKDGQVPDHVRWNSSSTIKPNKRGARFQVLDRKTSKSQMSGCNSSPISNRDC
jgi:hypothetical protein